MAKPKRKNAADIQVDAATAHSVALLRVSAGFRNEALAVLVSLERELIAKVEDLAPDSLESKRLTTLLEQTAAAIDTAYETIDREQARNLEEIAVIEGKFTARLLNEAVGVEVFDPGLSVPILKQVANKPVVMGHSAADWWAGQAVDLQNRFAAQMQSGLLIGESVDDLTKRIRGTKKNDFADGIMNVSKRDAEALVRSSVMSVSNQARIESFAEQGDIVNATQWVSTLDSRTSHICKALDGLKWKLPSYAPIGHDKRFPGPTAHWNCRSTQVAITKTWEELAGRKLPSLDNKSLQQAMDAKFRELGWSEERIAAAKANARASMDGQVSSTKTFNDWLHGKDKDFVDSVLGKGRAELWQDGKITMSDLTDQTNRPLSLAELEAMVALRS